MASFVNEPEARSSAAPNGSDKWNRMCKISSIILSVFYGLFSWIFAFLGMMFFSLGLPDKPFPAVCAFLAALLLLLTPVFCIIGILFSVRIRKKGKYTAAFLIQFLPFATLGAVLFFFLLSVI